MPRTLVLAGFTSPIAEALIEALPSSSWRLLGICCSRTERAAQLLGQAKARGLEARAVPCNIRQAHDVARLAELLPPGPDAVDLVYAAAGRLKLQGLARSNWASFVDQYETQVGGALHLLRLLVPRWVRSGEGRAVFVLSSVTVGQSAPGLGAYVAAKCGLLGIAQVLAQEHRQHGVSVAAVSPGAFSSELWADVPEQGRPAAESLDGPRRIAHEIIALLTRQPGSDGLGAPFDNIVVHTGGGSQPP